MTLPSNDYYRYLRMSSESCSFCSNRLETGHTGADISTTFETSCGHLFHTNCIDGFAKLCMEEGKPLTCRSCKKALDYSSEAQQWKSKSEKIEAWISTTENWAVHEDDDTN